MRRILADISLELRRGEFLTVVGPSGTGKTTLLRVLGGLTAGTRGAVHVNGRLIDGPPADVVIVFQDYSHALLQWRTVARNVAFGLEGKLPRSEINERVRDALRLVRLDGHADDYPWQLSGGMQQRVQIARALALRPVCSADGRTVCRTRRHDQGAAAGRAAPAARRAPARASYSSPTISRRRSISAIASR